MEQFAPCGKFRCKGDGMCPVSPFVTVQVCGGQMRMKGSAEKDIDHLHALANTEYRYATNDGQL